MSSTKPCPNCGSTTRTRSRRRVLEYLLPGLRPFRCLTCQRRFYAPRSTPASPANEYVEPSRTVSLTQPQPASAPARIPAAPSTSSPWFLIQDIPPQEGTSPRS